MNEFDLISRYFSDIGPSSASVSLGVGDDAAVLKSDNRDLVVCTDTMVAGVHFDDTTPVSDIGYKLFAVNVSDLAAMGADPVWATLNLTLPEFDENWLNKFSKGLRQAADQFGVQVIGGDTTRGPLCLSLTLGGYVRRDVALMRHGARPGDEIYVSGTIGDAALGLKVTLGHYQPAEEHAELLLRSLHRPEPNPELGQNLVGIASACIDVSDGLLADLGHVLHQSGSLGADLYENDIPLSSATSAWLEAGGELEALLNGGEDYVLCFTVSLESRDRLTQLFNEMELECHKIGRVTQRQGIRLHDINGLASDLEPGGFRHF